MFARSGSPITSLRRMESSSAAASTPSRAHSHNSKHHSAASANGSHHVPGGVPGGALSHGGGGGGASSRRRKMAFMKYGSDSNRSSTSRHRSRLHAKQIATTLGDDFPSPMSAYSLGAPAPFADFGSAFAGEGGGGTKDPFPDDSSTQIWDEDPFDEDSVSYQQQNHIHNNMNKNKSGPASFQPKWPNDSSGSHGPSTSRTMSTFPSNSSMQSTFAAQQSLQQQQQHYVSVAQHTLPTTPERTQQLKQYAAAAASSSAQSSPVPSYASSTHTTSTLGSGTGAGGGGGAAARRRMRIQSRASAGAGTGTAVVATHTIHRSDSDSCSQTPPHSPQSMKRYHSADSLGSHHSKHQQQHQNGTYQQHHPKSADRVSNYSVVPSAALRHHNHSSNNSFSANRSVGSTRSVTSSSSTNTELNNLFDNNRQPNAGFTFDAFGLDASLINQEVAAAMNDIAGNNPDLSFFLDQDPTDDFAAGRWDACTPPGSRSTTPVTTTTVSGGGGGATAATASTTNTTIEEGDGFVDGFRVTAVAANARRTAMLPVHVRQQSPTNTEKSSLTSESSDIPLADGGGVGKGQVNLFKQQAGFHTTSKPRKVVRPLEQQQEEGSSVSSSTATTTSAFAARLKASTKRQQAQREAAAVQSGKINRDLRGEHFLPNLNNGSTTSSAGDLTPRQQPLNQRPGLAQTKHHQRQHPEEEPVADPDLFEPDFSDFSVSSSNNGRDGNRQEVPSDVGVTGNYVPINSSTQPVDIVAELRAKKEERSMASAASVADLDNQSSHCFDVSPTSAQDEKKEEDVVPVKNTSIKAQQQPNVGSLKSQWEKRDAVRRAQIVATRSKDEKHSMVPSSSSNTTTTATTSPTGVGSSVRFEREKREGRTTLDSSSYDEIQQQSSFASLRGNLRPTSTQRHETYSGVKSEVGATFKGSHVSSIMTGLQAKSNEVARGSSQSDVGVPTPTFANLKLRKTAGSSLSAIANTTDVVSGLDRSGIAEDVMSQTLRHEAEQRHQDVESPISVPEEQPAAKLTYRERRELELQKEREDEERRRLSQQVSEPAGHDVASLIKRRIATNKRNAIAENSHNHLRGASAHGGDHGDDDENDAARGYLYTRQDSKPFDESPRFLVQHKDVDETMGSDDSRFRVLRDDEQQAEPHFTVNKTSEPATNAAAAALPKHDAAVSHLLMLQRIQQQRRPDELETVPPGGRSETPEPVGPEEKCVKASTPKATMMMLNAFLAGRESLTSKQATGGKSTQSIQDHAHEDEKGLSSTDNFSEDPENATHHLPARKDDPKYERYYKMLKVGMPMEVVKHAVMKDGLDPSVLDGNPNKPVGIPLKHDPEFAKYFKMLSFGMPMEAVKHAMARDGLDSSIMDQDHDLPLQSRKKDCVEEEEPTKEKDSHRRARLHWKPLRSVTSNSMWAKINQDDELDKIKFNEKEFEELFQIEKALEFAQKTSSSSSEVKRGAVRVIDPKRANNGGIILARLKMSHDEMADAVDGINERALTAEQIENIIEYLPSKEERKALETYMLEGGQDAAEKFDGLCECEKFMVSMMTVKHAKRKVRALLFKLQFQSCLEDIHRDTVAIEAACDELCNSVRLRKLLGIVLTFGNRLNTAGNGKRRAGAFTLDSLLKLNQAKAFDKKTTFLQYIVLIVQRNNELLLRFKDDLPTVYKADKIYWDQCVNDLEEVENQLENVRKIALYQARQATAYRLRRKKREEDEESLSDDEMSLTLEEEVEALRATPIGMFTLSAIKYVSSLRDRVEETKVKFAHLLEYFGEESNMQPHELFNIIVSFSRDFDKAKEQVFADEKRKQREERKRQVVASNAMGHHGRPPTHSPAHPDRRVNEHSLKASSLQPSISYVLKEIKTRISSGEADPSKATSKQASPDPSVILTPERTPPAPRVESSVDKAAPASRPTENRPPVPQPPLSPPDEHEKTSKTEESPSLVPAVLVEGASPITKVKSTPSASSGGSALRAKARLRRHRYMIERSPSSSSAASLAPPDQEAKPLVTTSAPRPAPTARATVSPTVERMYVGGPTSSADETAKSLPVTPKPPSPRTSMRNRMERHKLRQQPGSSCPSDVAC